MDLVAKSETATDVLIQLPKKEMDKLQRLMSLSRFDPAFPASQHILRIWSSSNDLWWLFLIFGWRPFVICDQAYAEKIQLDNITSRLKRTQKHSHWIWRRDWYGVMKIWVFPISPISLSLGEWLLVKTWRKWTILLHCDLQRPWAGLTTYHTNLRTM